MLQRKEDGSPEPPIRTGWWMLTVEFEDGVITPEQISLKLADSVGFVEGTGFVDVSYQGDIVNETEHNEG